MQADSLKVLMTNFAQTKTLLNYQEKLRLKNWLHLSLAYDFNPEDEAELKKLAMVMVNLKANVNWELRFYQKNLDWSWKCLQSWQLS